MTASRSSLLTARPRARSRAADSPVVAHPQTILAVVTLADALAQLAAGGGPDVCLAAELVEGELAVAMAAAAHTDDEAAAAMAAAAHADHEGADGGADDDGNADEWCNWCSVRLAIMDAAHGDPDHPGRHLCEVCVVDRNNREAYTRQFLQPALRAPSAQIHPIALQVGNRYFPHGVANAADHADHIVEIQFLAKLVAQSEHAGRSWSGNALFALRRWANSRENISLLSKVLNKSKGRAFKGYMPGTGPFPQVPGLPTLPEVFRAALQRLRAHIEAWTAQFANDAGLFVELGARIDAALGAI